MRQRFTLQHLVNGVVVCLPVLDVPAKVRLVAIGSGINSDMFVKL